VIGRVYYLVALMLLFATNAHLLLVRGFLASLEAAPFAGTDALRVFARSLVETFGAFVLAAVEIASPPSSTASCTRSPR
jgi:flagellar biosynthetic protein FliR